MSNDEEWIAALLERKETLVSGLENVGFLTRDFIRGIDEKLTDRLDIVMHAARECEALQEQLRSTGEEDTLLHQAKLFFERHNISMEDDADVKTAIPKTKTPLSENTIPAEEEEDPDHGVKPLSQAELDSVPKYMKGRITLGDVNEVVRVFSETLEYKHDLLMRPYQKLANKDKDLVCKWKEQGSDDSVIFCLDTEVRDRLSEKHKKNLRVVLPILRHLRRLRELRDKGATRLYPLAYIN